MPNVKGAAISNLAFFHCNYRQTLLCSYSISITASKNNHVPRGFDRSVEKPLATAMWLQQKASCSLVRPNIPQTVNRHRASAQTPTLPAPTSALSHPCAQLAGSCKSTALFLFSRPPYPQSISLYSYCAKGHSLPAAAFSLSPPADPSPCYLSDLVRAEIARNPADLPRPQGFLSLSLFLHGSLLYLHSKQRQPGEDVKACIQKHTQRNRQLHAHTHTHTHTHKFIL